MILFTFRFCHSAELFSHNLCALKLCTVGAQPGGHTQRLCDRRSCTGQSFFLVLGIILSVIKVVKVITAIKSHQTTNSDRVRNLGVEVQHYQVEGKLAGSVLEDNDQNRYYTIYELYLTQF